MPCRAELPLPEKVGTRTKVFSGTYFERVPGEGLRHHLRQAKSAPCGSQHGSRRESTEPGGWKEGD
jgi:hypothetical protein